MEAWHHINDDMENIQDYLINIDDKHLIKVLISPDEKKKKTS